MLQQQLLPQLTVNRHNEAAILIDSTADIGGIAGTCGVALLIVRFQFGRVTGQQTLAHVRVLQTKEIVSGAKIGTA